MNPSVRADTYLLDTQTGRIWKSVVFTDLQGSPEAWEEVDVLRTQADWLSFGTRHPPANTQPPAATAQPQPQVYVTPP
jgi:hypothetical protein